MLRTPSPELGRPSCLVRTPSSEGGTPSDVLRTPGPELGRIDRLAQELGPDSPEVQRRVGRLFTIFRFDTAMLILIVIDMTAKPSF